MDMIAPMVVEEATDVTQVAPAVFQDPGQIASTSREPYLNREAFNALIQEQVRFIGFQA